MLPEDEVRELDFDAFFQFTLCHEMCHGLGPGKIVVDGRQTEVRLELKDLYSALEEAKADVLGVSIYGWWTAAWWSREIIEHLPWTYTAGLFRSARFGTTEAHGLGVVIQANYLIEKGAVEITEDGRFRPVPERFRRRSSELASELLMVQAVGATTAPGNWWTATARCIRP